MPLPLCPAAPGDAVILEGMRHLLWPEMAGTYDLDAHSPIRKLVVASFAGWALGLVLGIGAIVIVESIGLPATQFPLALGMGAGVGLLQARALWRDVPGRRAWLLATALGLAAPFIVLDVSNLAGRPLPFSLTAYVGLGGLVAGILQWRLLRRVCDGAAWWLVASPLAWLLAASPVWINERLLPKTPGLLGAIQYLRLSSPVASRSASSVPLAARGTRRIVSPRRQARFVTPPVPTRPGPTRQTARARL